MAFFDPRRLQECRSWQFRAAAFGIAFTRRIQNGETTWFADGKPIKEQATSPNVVSDNASYTEYETGKNEHYTVVDTPYGLRLDYVKGTLDIWLYERYGEESQPGEAWTFTASCEPPMK